VWPCGYVEGDDTACGMPTTEDEDPGAPLAKLFVEEQPLPRFREGRARLPRPDGAARLHGGISPPFGLRADREFA